jgi:pilus assembly protein Flp/PilA
MLTKLFVFAQTHAQQLRRDDRGATMVEYGLLVALIAVVVAIGATTLGTAVRTLFETVAGQV